MAQPVKCTLGQLSYVQVTLSLRVYEPCYKLSCIASCIEVTCKQCFEGLSWKTIGDALKNDTPDTYMWKTGKHFDEEVFMNTSFSWLRSRAKTIPKRYPNDTPKDWISTPRTGWPLSYHLETKDFIYHPAISQPIPTDTQMSWQICPESPVATTALDCIMRTHICNLFSADDADIQQEIAKKNRIG